MQHAFGTILSLIDFTRGKFGYRLKHCQGRNELIAKAIGFKPNAPLTVFDTTAGLGREAFLLASLGCNVTLFERHPVVAKNLEEALSKARLHPHFSEIANRMNLIQSCAIRFFKEQAFTPPDVIYCDPMFVPREKTAAVKKELQQLQALVGQDNDAEELVALAYQFAKKRVVVKRALRSPPLFKEPDFSYKARSHRFDIYIMTSLSDNTPK